MNPRRYLTIYAELWKNSVVREMGFKANFLLWIVVELLWFALQLTFITVIYRAGFYPEPVLAAVKQSYKGAQQIDMNGYQYTILLPDPAAGK